METLLIKLKMTIEAINGFGGHHFPELRKKWEKERDLLKKQISVYKKREADWIYKAINNESIKFN